jgi:mono/diheme cytochrome c family protein
MSMVIPPLARNHRPAWCRALLAGLAAAALLWRPGFAQAPAAPQASFPLPQVTAEARQAQETFLRVCLKCHAADRVMAEGRSRSQWENTMIAMQTSRGAVITPEEFDVILDYLTKFHGRDSVAQTPAAAPGPGASARGPRANVGAADRHRVDPAGADRGRKIYAAECVTCHGPSARGTERGSNLVRSPRVLRDRYGSAIGPFLKSGHPMQTGKPSASLTDAQLTDLSHFIWDRINNTLRGSPEFDVKDVLTGNAGEGESYFNGEGRCRTCHSPTGDLAGYGKRYAPVDIQQRMVFPFAVGGRGRGGNRPGVTVTVTMPNRPPVSGTLVSIDDFHVALREASGSYRSFARTPAMNIQKQDPLAPHVELLDRLTDKAMHDLVAYLESLK